jgi:hypothetical protein
MQYAEHDVPAQDPDEVFRDGFLAGIFARNPYHRDTVEYLEWKSGHDLTSRPAPKRKRILHCLRRFVPFL